MTRRTSLFRVAGILAICLALPAQAADWPQFRGPSRDGTADGAGLLTAWSEGQPKEIWRKSIGGGFSSVAVAGERLFVMAQEADGETLLCIDAASGETVWRAVVGESAGTFPEDGPRSTPTISQGSVFAVTSRGLLAAYNVEDGAPIWSKNLKEWGPAPRFGYAVSPLVDGDLVIVETGRPGKSPGIVALDRKTGELRWSALEGPTGYATPIVVELGGVRQYVFLRPRPAELLALSTEGEVLWRQPTPGAQSVIVSPLFLPPDRFFVSTSDDGFGGAMLRVSSGEDGFQVEPIWQERLMRNHFSASVAVDGHLYGFDNATFRCLDAETGERKWAKRGLGKGSLVAAGNSLLVLADDGTLVLVRATPAGYLETGRIQAMEGRSWTSPSLADGRLYLRDSDELVGFDLRGKPTKVAKAAASEEQAPLPANFLENLSVKAILDRYLEARGGAENWGKLRTLVMEGSYSAFSETSDFALIRERGDLYRLDFTMLDKPAIRARDADGPWGQHAMLQPEPARIEGGPYAAQYERESLFEPLLFDPASKGVQVTLLGPGEVDGKPTIDLGVTLRNGEDEIWHLDPHTFLEVMVERQVTDFTQSPQPFNQQAHFTDFREVGGVLLPHRIDYEFGARLETMIVRKVEVNREIEDDWLMGPEKAPADGGP